jgi:hypothetical protein
MNHRVLAREGQVKAHTNSLEYDTILVKTVECVLKLHERFFRVVVTPCNIAELQKCTESADNILWNMPLDCREINLGIMLKTLSDE